MIARLLGSSNWEKLAEHAEFDPGKMADLCLISLRQLERIFAGQFHKTPERWIVELKCRLAERLIAQGYSTKAAAAELKFASQCHFCRQFKKLRGACPQAFSPIYGRLSEVSFKVNDVV